MASKPPRRFEVDTPKGKGEVRRDYQSDRWVISLPWGDSVFHGSYRGVVRHTSGIIDMYQKANP
jgi:hypothetical protein